MVRCKAYFHILDRLGVTHECDRPGMGTRRMLETETRPRRWLHQPRRDRDETFVALETLKCKFY